MNRNMQCPCCLFPRSISVVVFARVSIYSNISLMIEDEKMIKEKYGIQVLCPWCQKGETLADRTAPIHVSCQCPKCGRFYRINFSDLTTEKATAFPRERRV